MKCLYCELYHNSTARLESNQRFCRIKQKMVFDESEICDKFEASTMFWCNNTDCWIDLRICTNRQYKELDECKNCNQKKDVLQIRRFMGRQQSTSNPQIRKPIMRNTITRVEEQKTNIPI